MKRCRHKGLPSWFCAGNVAALIAVVSLWSGAGNSQVRGEGERKAPVKTAVAASSSSAVSVKTASVPLGNRRDHARPPRVCRGGSASFAARLRADRKHDYGKLPWSRLSAHVREDIRAGRPLVTLVYVPLCSNHQIWCGSRVAGNPVGLNTNIYWGAIYGARTFFDRYGSTFTRVAQRRGKGWDLQRIVYRRRVPGAPWGLAKGAGVEQLVVLQAVHGSYINQAVFKHWKMATEGGCVTFKDGGRLRKVRVHVVGYAGHDRLMDGVKLPPVPPPGRAAPIPSFVLACFSNKYFGPSLRRAGSRPLLMTASYMAPEGYLVRSVVESLAANATPEQIAEHAADVQRRWQKNLTMFRSRRIFAPFEL